MQLLFFSLLPLQIEVIVPDPPHLFPPCFAEGLVHVLDLDFVPDFVLLFCLQLPYPPQLDQPPFTIVCKRKEKSSSSILTYK